MLKFEIRQEPLTIVDEYARIPIAFDVCSILEVTAKGGHSGEFVLREQRLDVPYRKDYDVISGGKPMEWWRHERQSLVVEHDVGCPPQSNDEQSGNCNERN
jgi:hypothetical protein